MTEYSNENRGSIWPAKEKKSDKHPDFEGSQNVCCPKCGEKTDYWVSGWKRKADANPKSPSLSWSIKPKDGKPKAASSGSAPRKSLAEDMDDVIPF
jgi:hypothetical protein